MSREAAEAAEPASASVQAPGAKGSRRCSVNKGSTSIVGWKRITEKQKGATGESEQLPFKRRC